MCGGGAEEGDGNRLPVLEQLKRKFDKRKDRTLTYLLRFSLSLLHSPLSISSLIQSMLTFVSGNPAESLKVPLIKPMGMGSPSRGRKHHDNVRLHSVSQKLKGWMDRAFSH